MSLTSSIFNEENEEGRHWCTFCSSDQVRLPGGSFLSQRWAKVTLTVRSPVHILTYQLVDSATGPEILPVHSDVGVLFQLLKFYSKDSSI
jgi:hypothetical protein